jgi:hypothetical protein
VPEALDKALKTLGKDFAECRTWQRRLATQCIGKAFFAEYFFSGTRQRGLPSARQHSSKKSSHYGVGWRRQRLCRVSRLTLGKGVTFAECCRSGTRQRIHLCRVPPGTLGKDPAREGPHVRFFAECPRRHSAKACFFAECQGHYTRQRTYTGAQVLVLCRVIWPGHSAKNLFVECYTRQSDQ